jgi:cytochrome d ubiquinol oxidase subunit II
MGWDLALIWAAILGLAVLIYVVLDGFDLGIGIVAPLARDREERGLMMNTVAPVWDGNETWLVLGGGGLMAVFPMAYGIVMSALYIPVILMLLALVFRGVAFEFRWRTERWKGVWDAGFFWGSLVAALMQGIALGAVVQGIAVEGRAYAGGWWDWLTPFSVLCGVAVVTGYALLGVLWLNLKLAGEIQARVRALALPLAVASLGFIGLVSLWTPFLNPAFYQRWFAWPTLGFSLVVPGLLALAFWRIVAGLRAGRELGPFVAALAMFVLAVLGAGISFYPDLLPPHVTIAEAAAPQASLAFALVGAAVLLPVILAYTAYAYWVFRGKLDPSEGYH